MQPAFGQLEEPQKRAEHQPGIEPRSAALDIFAVQHHFALHAHQVAYPAED